MHGVSLVSGLLSDVVYDYVSLATASTTDTWSFRTGGVSGRLVATVVITYTDSGKGTISTVART